MPPANRRRKPRSVTLNPVLVTRLLKLGEAQGETRLSVLLDDAMREYLDRHEPKRGDSERPRRGGK